MLCKVAPYEEGQGKDAKPNQNEADCHQPKQLDKQLDIYTAIQKEPFCIEDEKGSPEETEEEDVVGEVGQGVSRQHLGAAEELPQLLLVLLQELAAHQGRQGD